MGFWAWFLNASHATFFNWRRGAEGPKTIISVQLWGTLTPSGMETVEDLDGNVFSNNTIYITGLIKCGMRGIEGKWIFDEISVKWWNCKNQGFGRTCFLEKNLVSTEEPSFL